MTVQVITEETAHKLIDTVGQLNISIAVFENKLSEFTKDLDRQGAVNSDIEIRMKQREIEAAKQAQEIAVQAKWQERATGALITIAVALIITIGTGLIIIFGKGSP